MWELEEALNKKLLGFRLKIDKSKEDHNDYR